MVPILVLWFGIGTVPAILTAFLVAFFPITVNIATGIATMEPELRDVLGQPPQMDILRVGLPMPYSSRLKIAITLAFVGAVISETVASNVGIGYLMMSASASFRVPLVLRRCWSSRPWASSCMRSRPFSSVISPAGPRGLKSSDRRHMSRPRNLPSLRARAHQRVLTL